VTGEKKQDIIKLTIDFWNERYGVSLTEEDVKEAVKNIAGFFSVLQEWEKKAS
jgi:hypothetical protein